MSDLKEMECHMECLCLRERETQFCLKKHVLGQMSELTVEGKKKVDNGKGNGSNDTEHHAGHSLCPYFTGTWDPLLNCAPPFPPPQQVPTSPPFLPQQVPVPPPLSLTQPAPTPPCFPQPPHAYVGLMPTYGPHHVPDAAPGPSPASWLSESLPASPSAPAVTSTPVGLRTRSHQQLGTLQQPIKDEPESKILTAPMVQVMGPTGEAAFVFRPWTYQDMKDNLHHLPDIADGGTFAAALLTFCQQFTPTVPELNRLLMMKLGPTDHMKIANFVTSNHCPVNPRMDRRQNADETVADYFSRLYKVFKDNSGLTEPTVMEATPSPWEVHLSNAFRNGLLPRLADAVNKSCVCVNEARLEDIRRHALHAQDCMARNKEKEGKTSQRCHLQGPTHNDECADTANSASSRWAIRREEEVAKERTVYTRQ
ncbi:uncharacterized protein LOC144001495 [Festucalex cinctus]